MTGNLNHPAYAIIRTALLMLALCYILWLNASRFDATEVTSLVQMFLATAGIESGVKVLKAVMRPKGDE